jgi:uncharacterized secreted protein with C-terminal beta-propeller domain
MQKEIKKRVQTYGIAAVALALVLGTLCYNFGINPIIPSPFSTGFLKTFSSYEELKNFLGANSKLVVFPWVSGGACSGGSFEYSTTNVQVAGVDEADIVKTDGNHIYLIANNSIFILKAYPPEEAKVLSKIPFNETSPAGIFISTDSSRLAVLGNWQFSLSPLPSVFATYIFVYDISNKTNPVLMKDFIMTGKYVGSRMIGEYVYAVISEPARIIYYGILPYYEIVTIPAIYTEDKFKEIEVSRIYYSNTSDNYYAFTTVVALNMFNDEEPSTLTVLMGGTSNMYVSLNNIYITFHEPDGQTSIYRVRTENKTLTCEAQGKVPGRELNQFSMDEYNNHFRVATTTSVNGTTQNNLYILDMNLTTVGKLENITEAFNEQLDSARFIGDRCYLATSIVQVVPRDPFLVIDVEDPSDPKVLGYLKIPGFTRYLHPYNENHVIGVGRDENNSVKISIFDVSNVSVPIEIDKYAVEGIWSDTPVLTDHKAFLFDKAKELLVIPVSVSLNGTLWQGVYVFNINITLSDKLVFKGNVTHQETGVWNSNYWIQRALYIENVLYTTSNVKVKLNSLEDLEFIDEVELS